MTRAKAAGLSAAFLFSGLALSVGFTGLASRVVWPEGASSLAASASLQTLVSILAFGIATWVFGFRLGGLRAGDLRWHGNANGAVRGFLLGSWPAIAVMALAVPLAGAAWMPDGGTMSDWAGTLPGLAIIFLPAAFAEEFSFRGAGLVLLARAIGRPLAVVTLAAFFALAHVLNPAVTTLGLVNVGLAGIFLGAVFYLPGGLWTATAAHFAWNMTLATLAAPVSGLPFLLPGIDYRPGSPTWLSGGTFGPEGGVIATAVLTLATLVALRFTERPKESYA
ncbi:MAG TPA: CPBP family intramembrane glutamic endopeptidase [Gemmatimonadales bacterium]|nr:CPBP family intramembrane glutamic endopeptidase [Gemmatimonadales bacterium]